MNASQLTFEVEGGAMSQTDKLITALMEANGGWLDLPTLVAFTGAYAVHSRACDARRKGYNIENKTERDPLTGQRHSYYRVVA